MHCNCCFVLPRILLLVANLYCSSAFQDNREVHSYKKKKKTPSKILQTLFRPRPCVFYENILYYWIDKSGAYLNIIIRLVNIGGTSAVGAYYINSFIFLLVSFFFFFLHFTITLVKYARGNSFGKRQFSRLCSVDNRHQTSVFCFRSWCIYVVLATRSIKYLFYFFHKNEHIIYGWISFVRLVCILRHLIVEYPSLGSAASWNRNPFHRYWNEKTSWLHTVSRRRCILFLIFWFWAQWIVLQNYGFSHRKYTF